MCHRPGTGYHPPAPRSTITKVLCFALLSTDYSLYLYQSYYYLRACPNTYQNIAVYVRKVPRGEKCVYGVLRTHKDTSSGTAPYGFLPRPSPPWLFLLHRKGEKAPIWVPSDWIGFKCVCSLENGDFHRHTRTRTHATLRPPPGAALQLRTYTYSTIFIPYSVFLGCLFSLMIGTFGFLVLRIPYHVGDKPSRDNYSNNSRVIIFVNQQTASIFITLLRLVLTFFLFFFFFFSSFHPSFA